VRGRKAKRIGLNDVAVIQSLQRKGAVEDFVADYGQVIVNEGHHLSVVTFERILREVKAKIRLGIDGNTDSKRWALTHYLHTMRPDSFSS
jgi:hypothetical protein